MPASRLAEHWAEIRADATRMRLHRGLGPQYRRLGCQPPVADPYARPELSLGEAAARLGLRRSELEAMVRAGKIEALPVGFTRMIPTQEIERLVALRIS